jgi:membrane-associated protease RseP (regulator of RpoE activity)
MRFVESQQVWDRAMAQGIADARARDPQALVVGIMGSGHVLDGHGVPHQLRDLGVKDVVAFVPWDRGEDCSRLVVGLADAVFGMPAPLGKPAPRARLGVMLEGGDAGVRITGVEKGSIAEAAGLRAGDVVAEAAGVGVKQAGELAELVQRQAPGTWLPLKVKRESSRLEVVAKFPPSAAP